MNRKYYEYFTCLKALFNLSLTQILMLYRGLLDRKSELFAVCICYILITIQLCTITVFLPFAFI